MLTSQCGVPGRQHCSFREQRGLSSSAAVFGGAASPPQSRPWGCSPQGRRGGAAWPDRACLLLALQDESTAEITFYMKGADVAMSSIVQYNDWLEEEVTCGVG